MEAKGKGGDIPGWNQVDCTRKDCVYCQKQGTKSEEQIMKGKNHVFFYD
jgi:hypothetical protein